MSGFSAIFTLPREGQARLQIYNLLGQKVVRLREEFLPAGGHTAMWDGTDQQGHAVRSGIYFARLTTGSEEFVRKIALVR